MTALASVKTLGRLGGRTAVAGLEHAKIIEMTAQQGMREIRGAVSPDCGPENYDFTVADVLTKVAAIALSRQVDIIFDRPPGPNPGGFIDVEDEAGAPIPNGYRDLKPEHPMPVWSLDPLT